MVLKKFLSSRLIFCVLTGFALLGLISCGAGGIQPSPGAGRRPVPDQTRPEKPSPDRQTDQDKTMNPSAQSRMRASLTLTRQARELISEGRADRAIRALERAVSIHPSSWQNYYHLAEAWLLKENTDQALHFNELASLHLPEDTPEQKRIADQRRRIKQLAESMP